MSVFQFNQNGLSKKKSTAEWLTINAQFQPEKWLKTYKQNF